MARYTKGEKEHKLAVRTARVRKTGNGRGPIFFIKPDAAAEQLRTLRAEKTTLEILEADTLLMSGAETEKLRDLRVEIYAEKTLKSEDHSLSRRDSWLRLVRK